VQCVVDGELQKWDALILGFGAASIVSS
jgi:hypothetical protein